MLEREKERHRGTEKERKEERGKRMPFQKKIG